MNSNSKLPREIWALGFVSLLMDVSSETIHSILPVFLFTVLGASATSIGLLEGFAEATALVFKVVSGPLSDWMKRRRPLVILGYAMGAISKPLFAIATSIPMVFGARIFDRMGKGIRGAPRDALIADLAPPEIRGSAFGLRQSLDTVGAFVGPLLAIILLSLTNNNYRAIFWLAAIPGALAVMILYFGVRERRQKARPIDSRFKFTELKQFSRSFWFVVIFGAVFQLARFSEAFLILRGNDLGLGREFSPVILIVMNVVYAVTSYPVGRLSDRIKREWFLMGGFLVLILSDLLLAYSQNVYVALIGVGFWGLQLGLTQGTLSTLVADTCPPNYKGTAYGVFNLFSAIALLLASTVAGTLWDQFGPQTTFLAGAVIAFISLVLFLMTKSIWRSK